MLMLYAWAIIPFIYLTSFCFDSAGSACVKLIITLTFLASAPLFSSQSQVKKVRTVTATHHTALTFPPAATEVVPMKTCVCQGPVWGSSQQLSMEEPQTVNVPNMHLQEDRDTQWLYSSAEYAQQQRGNRRSPRAAVQTSKQGDAWKRHTLSQKSVWLRAGGRGSTTWRP